MIGVRIRLLGSVLFMLWGGVSVADQLAPDDLDNPVAPPKLELKTGSPAPNLSIPHGNRVTKFGNIRVAGGKQQLRGSIASQAMQLHKRLNKLINSKGRELESPLIIQLHGKQGDVVPSQRVVTEIRKVENQYQLLIHVHLAQGVEYDKLRYHVMEMLLYERGLVAGQKLEDGERFIVKPWLITGLLEVIDLRNGGGDRSIYQADAAYFKLIRLREVFDVTEARLVTMNGVESMAFRAISGAVVSALIRQPKGRSSMAHYLKNFATFKGEPENLMRQHFPSMNQSRNSLEKWVNLEMLELGTARTSDVFSILETERRLESMLTLRFRDKDEVAKQLVIDDFEEVVALDSLAERAHAVAGAGADIKRLSYRSFPTYRPILLEYGMILNDIVEAKAKAVKTIPERLENLKRARVRNVQAAERLRDYLDWYYITQSDDVSASFKKYRELSDALEREKNRVDASDATESYLDAVQRMYAGSGDASSE